MYSQGLDMSLDKVMETRVARASDGRHVSSGSKQKWGGPFVDSGNVIRIAIECRLMHILMCNVDDMKPFLDVPDEMKFPYCNMILQENP
ncbi:retrotransposon protein [Cucumis melo var. makuwa]|uniref:Retrotransposon protein n=1 Tax=Cucumis melo var. makuwa TaxID=1194695 RepID=A0A5D3D2K5_CUCMM|nr:retrotransposon protein [Cucumis melo var. makuwa]